MFMLHTDRVEVESGAEVERQRAVQRSAWFHRRLGSSRGSEASPRMMMSPDVSSSVSIKPSAPERVLFTQGQP